MSANTEALPAAGASATNPWSSIVLTCVDFSDGKTGPAEDIPKSLRQRLALVVEIPLGRYVVKVERIGIALIREGSAMADDNHKPSSAQHLRDILIIRGRRTQARQSKHCTTL